MTIAQADSLSLTFSALADPTRRRILALLAGGERSVSELAAPFTLSQPAISKHLKVLELAGLISRGRKAQWRPAKLEAQALKGAADWVEQYRVHWEQRFDQLDDYMMQMQMQSESDGPDAAGEQSDSSSYQPE